MKNIFDYGNLDRLSSLFTLEKADRVTGTSS